MNARRTRAEQWARFGGLAFTMSGVAHLICPRAFESVNRLAFKDNIRAHVLINSSIETGLGIAVVSSRTRRAALAVTAAYLTYFTANLLYRQRVLRN